LSKVFVNLTFTKTFKALLVDLFEKLKMKKSPLGQWSKEGYGYFMFPKLEGEISNKMIFRGKECLVWSINNYLGLANNPEVRKADVEATEKFGLALPMGARMMSGNSNYHEKLESELSSFLGKEDTILVNYGYQGMFSAIDSLLDRRDVVIYDSECHACIVDGVRLHQGKRFVFQHNNMQSLEKQLERASHIIDETEGSIFVITEGVFGMSGEMGKLCEIVALKKKYMFRFLVDDAHGFGTMGNTGAGAGQEQGVQDEIDIYFGTFAKSMASIGAFLSSNENIIEYLRYSMRSQIFAKSLPMPLVIGGLKRLELIQKHPEYKQKLWKIAKALQIGLTKEGFDMGNTQSPVTPVYLRGSVPEAAGIVVDLRENYHIFCSIVIYPVVPKGVIMLRLIPTAMHTMEDVQYTIETFATIRNNLKEGKYDAEKIMKI